MPKPKSKVPKRFAMILIPFLITLPMSAYALDWNTTCNNRVNASFNNTNSTTLTNGIFVWNISATNDRTGVLVNSTNHTQNYGININGSSWTELITNMTLTAKENRTLWYFYNCSGTTEQANNLFYVFDSFNGNSLYAYNNFSWSSMVFGAGFINITTASQPSNQQSGLYNNTTAFNPTYTIFAKSLITNAETGIGLWNRTETYNTPDETRRASMIINGNSYYSFYCNAHGGGCTFENANIGATTNVWYKFKMVISNTTGYTSDIWSNIDTPLIQKTYAGKETMGGYAVYIGSQSPAEAYTIDYAGVFYGNVSFYSNSSITEYASEAKPYVPIVINPVIIGLVCFKTQPVCVRLSDNLLYKQTSNVII